MVHHTDALWGAYTHSLQGKQMKISDLQVGDSAKIISYGCGSKPYRQRLLVMGLTPSTEFCLTRVAPLGDPIQLRVRGYDLSLRKSEAKMISVEKI